MKFAALREFDEETHPDSSSDPSFKDLLASKGLSFADKLFKQHGIYSYTFGANTPKTPQNGSVFLTKDDLEKIARTSQITFESGSGSRAYQTKASIFEQKKLYIVQVAFQIKMRMM